MDVNAVMQLIGSLGFPIVACVGLFWMMNRQNELHREETQSLKEAVNELKIAIIELTSKIERDKYNGN